MNRKCRFFANSKDKKRAIYVDSINSKEIIEYFKQDNRHLKKLKYITERLLEHSRVGVSELYCKIEVDKKSVGVTEIRLFVGQENDRIYCKEIVDENNNVQIIIMSILHEKKKTDDLSSKELSKINTVGGYNYEIE